MQNGKGEGGMSIAIKENLKQYVKTVEAVNDRSMVMHIKTQIRGKMIILNTHAPDVSDAIDIRQIHCNHIKQIIQRGNRGGFPIWATGSNEQVSRNLYTDDEIIGKLAKAT